MASAELFNFALALFLFYLAARFIAVAAAMAGLEGEGFAAPWMRSDRARRFLSSKEPPGALFALGAGKMADALERIVGRGSTRKLTFAFLTAIVLFLLSLPVAQLQRAGADYALLRRQIADPIVVERGPGYACVYEHALAEIERRLGRPLFDVPERPRLYPPGDRTKAILAAAKPPVPVELFVRQLMSGRKMSANARDIMPGMRAYPPVAKWLRRTGGAEPLPDSWYMVTPLSPGNAAVARRIEAFCLNEPSETPPGFEPLRPRVDYDRIVERFRLGTLAIVDDRFTRESYNLFQQKRAETHLILAFIYSVGVAFLVLFSLAASIGLCRLPRPRWSVEANFGATALALPMVPVFALLFMGFNAVQATASPFVVGYVIARSNAGADEAEYRYRVSRLVDSFGRLTRRTCADIGPSSPITPHCRLSEAYLEPWNPATGQFDFSKLVPREMDGGAPAPAMLVDFLDRSVLSLGLAGASMEKDAGLSLTPLLWGGMQSSPTLLLLVAPFLLVFSGAAFLLFLLDTRRILLRRLERGPP